VLDWHLIYRDGQKVEKLIPERVPAGESRVVKDSTGVNVFLEIKKPLACPTTS
jgi:extracellular factor (EF) 3-hydroxypalmitic acid methyl ester biosynthesis protein